MQALKAFTWKEATRKNSMADKFLIVGLGNPGKQYEATRHNIGFAVLEAFARRTGISGKTESKFNAIVGTGKYGGRSLILAQPLTFMNLSGEAVSKLMKYYDLEPEQLLVVYDEAALPFGRIRIRPNGSDAGQKGMKSIIANLGGNQNFPRLRVGIGSPPAPMAMPDYVLGKFSEAERQDLPRIIDTAMDAMEAWMAEGTEAAMTRFNGLVVTEA
jgi:PTH1 family peptidyl-tRNA hydrolase